MCFKTLFPSIPYYNGDIKEKKTNINLINTNSDCHKNKKKKG